jgi:hypothetical protein
MRWRRPEEFIHFARTSNRGRVEGSVDGKGHYPKGVITKSDETLERRFGGLIYVPVPELGRMPSRAQLGACPRRRRSRLPTKRTACKVQEDNRPP